jgi:DNA polymerase-4
VPLSALTKALGPAAGHKLHELAWARDPRAVTTLREEKSVGHEVTFEYDITDSAVIRRELLRMSDQVAVRLRTAGLVGRTVVLKLRYGDFTTISRSRKLEEHTSLGRRIYDEVTDIYASVERPDARIRLVGVRMEQLADSADAALGLWETDEGWRDAEHAIDAVSERFGRGLVRPAALVKPAGAAKAPSLRNAPRNGVQPIE